jgi:hydrogenase expression/formation protein HypE
MNEFPIYSPKSLVKMAHGGGGSLSHELTRDIFVKHFSNPALDAMGDSAIIGIPKSHLAYTTDSYVVKPLFFPGGDIGKLAVCGTVNDLAVSGARPIYLTAGFIIEEGFPLQKLDCLVRSMAQAAHDAGVFIVAGDTKVVEKGACDGIFINTSGIGEFFCKEPMTASRIRSGDAVIINGHIADHGMAIMGTREGLAIETSIESDCAPLSKLAENLLAAVPETRFMRDATRGGLATVICEAVTGQNFGIELYETQIPLREGTAVACELLGIDPLYVANEGKLVAVVPSEKAQTALAAMQTHPRGRDAAIIGRALAEDIGCASLVTHIGSKRRLAMFSGEQLPRIC